jgi:Lamin Tail Domain
MRNRGAQGAAAIWGLVCGVMVVVLVLTVVAVGQARAGRPAGRATVGNGGLAPVTFTYTGGEQTYTVPAGVTSLQLQAVGANGGDGPPSGSSGSTPGGSSSPIAGGTGGMVIGDLAVAAGAAIAPGDELYVAVGGTATGNRGGFNVGGHAQGNAGGGGGATEVRTCSRTATSCPYGVPSLLTRLIVAAGGGGAGGCDQSEFMGCAQFAGPGGSAGQPGGVASGAFSFLPPGPPAFIGGAGTIVAPGAGGIGPNPGSGANPPGDNGSGGGADTGGAGGSPPAAYTFQAAGGGGGAGYTGGGGASTATLFNSNAQLIGVATGGGGGGANFASPLAVAGASFALGDGTPRLLITPRPASAIRVSRIYYDSPGPDTATNKSLNAEFVRLTNTSRTAAQLRGWTISDSNGHVYRFGRLRLRPGGSVTVHSGRGRDTRRDRYWNRRGYVWDNTHELVRVHTPRGRLADQCRYDNSHASQLRC